MNEQTKIKLIQLGFTEDEINKMADTFKNTLKLSPQKVESAFNELINQGLDEQSAHDFFVHTPSIFGKAVETTRKQFDLYRQIFGDRYIEVISDSPRRLIQGPETIINRLNYFKSENIPLAEVQKNIFIGKKQFKKKYGVEL
ncbi:hypothetical protein SAMN05660649_04327 [Desulfotomaculum arcticum]|uniref:Uncharacterized protein n=1 Tax=Desulfotruncus arcticus DSM 17038 TaxID=1121424 RepID=A0A1I2YAB9_9FIRM|nr:hypothetical protein [Desulfotruncus arcticus]SFH22309.1 hypothetical protein SAMN05660649_04327 [Desulfotomaculum arcticum] [Desulfotruncus arcticus DSM 17038]